MLLALFGVLLWSSHICALVEQAPTPISSSLQPRVLWRGDGRPPEYFRSKGGILEGEVSPPTEFSLWRHTHWQIKNDTFDTAYTATSLVIGQALKYYHSYLKNMAYQPYGYVYLVHATPNCLSVNQSLLQHSFCPWEQEYACLGGIHWDQIEGWIDIPVEFVSSISGILESLTFHDLSARFIRNDDYRKSRYDAFSATEGQPQLAGWDDSGRSAEWKKEEPWSKFQEKTASQYAVDFMWKYGRDVGFNGTFPLKFTVPQGPFNKTNRDALPQLYRPKRPRYFAEDI
ncbi:putative enterotoxin [Cordyceps sp. RAO-2017]|nr:putative enterotoxin [Cordyceps sp. RAO-2017]